MKELLPIGTVVILKGAKKRVMIKVFALGYQDRETFLYMNALQEKIEELKESVANGAQE